MNALLASVPDLPANVFARSMLLEPGAVVRGDLVIRKPEGAVLAIVGTPKTEDIQAALSESPWPLELVGPLDAADAMQRASRRRGVRSTLFVAPAGWKPGPSSKSTLAEDPTLWAPPMGPLIQQGRLATAKLGDDVAAICTAAFVTEKYWDVALETPANRRGQGFATDVFNLLARRQLEDGRLPVWNAPANNAGAVGLAKKLGLTPAAEIFYVA